MKPIAVEAKKSFAHGFVLTEADLRRIVDLLESQFAKLDLEQELSCTFHVRFKNGVIAETSNLDDVLSQENSGSAKILRCGLRYYRQGGEDHPVASLEFVNVDEDEQPGYVSIRYALRADSRDWVFVTSSLLAERVEKVKRFAPNQLGARGGSRSVTRLALGILVPVVVLPLIFLFLFAGVIRSLVGEAENPLSEQLQMQLDRGDLTDPIVALIQIQKHQEDTLARSFGEAYKQKNYLLVAGGVLGLVLVVSVLALFLVRYYPVYNFVWGDYEHWFKKREDGRKFWLVVVGIGLAVSAIGGLIANMLSSV